MPENAGINILPQFNSGLPVAPGEIGNPLNQEMGGYPSGAQPTMFPSAPPPPTFTGGAPSNARNYPMPGTPYYSGGPGGYPMPGYGTSPSTGWRTNASPTEGVDWVGTGQDVGRNIGNFFGRAAMPYPGVSQLGGFLGRQAGSLVGHGIFGALGSISNLLGKLFGKEDQNAQPSAARPAPATAPAMPNFGTVFNAGRPAFSPTYQQINNPGSGIGPTSGMVSNPYGNPAAFTPAGLSRMKAGWDTSIPGFARNNMSEVRKRNII